MTDWVEVYRPLIGKRLDALIWMPIRADTSDLVRDMNSPAFSFSGGVFLAFEEQRLFLSWKQTGLDHALGTGPDAVWSGYALDRVRVSWDRTWASVEGATLIGVEFFIGPTIDDAPIDEREIMAVRHRLRLTKWSCISGSGRAVGTSSARRTTCGSAPASNRPTSTSSPEEARSGLSRLPDDPSCQRP